MDNKFTRQAQNALKLAKNTAKPVHKKIFAWIFS